MSQNRKEQHVLAIAAHPDDIEFMMAGTMLRLREAGYGLHYLNISTGNCGSTHLDAEQTRQTREQEARTAAKILGARFYPPFRDDLEILYEVSAVRILAAVVREVRPTIVLTHSPEDYMEDHMTASRLAVTAAFAHGMPNFQTDPPREPFYDDVTVYHAMSHSLRDGMRRRILPETFVDTDDVQEVKREALAAHTSQQEWLDNSQGMNSYLLAMEEMAQAVGKMSGRFKRAEGWRRHLHVGFSREEVDPLSAALGDRCLQNRAYANWLERSDDEPGE